MIVDKKTIEKAEQLLSCSNRGEVEPIFGGLLEDLLGAIGAAQKPKIIPVGMESRADRRRWGLFSVRQGLPPGRRTDFSGLRRIGGHVVPVDTLPAQGVVEWVPHGLDMNSLPPETSGPRQWLRTDGLRWQAWVCEKSNGPWRLRESLGEPVVTENEAADESLRPDSSRLMEFLRRAFLDWSRRHEPATLARYLASYGREEKARLLTGGGNRLTTLSTDWIAVTGEAPTDPHALAANWATLRMLGRFAGALGLDGNGGTILQDDLWSHGSAVPAPSASLADVLACLWPCLACIDAKGRESTFFPPRQERRHRDERLVEVFRFFWAQLVGTAQKRGGDFLSKEIPAAAGSQAGEAWRALAASVGEERVQAWGVADLNAGRGDFLLAALHEHPDPAAAASLPLMACETHPVGAELVRLRLALWAGAVSPASKPAGIHVYRRDVFRDGAPAEDMGRCLVIGEACPHVDRMAALSTAPKESTRHGRPDRAADQGKPEPLQAVGKLVTAIRDATTRKSEPPAFSLRIPAEWTDDAEYADARREALADLSYLYVNDQAAGPRPKDRRLAWGEVVLTAWPRPLDDEADRVREYRRVDPRPENRHSVLAAASPYASWPSLDQLALRPPLNGSIERRGMSLIDIDRDRLDTRLRDYFSDLPDAKLRRLQPDMMRAVPRFDPAAVRRTLRANTEYIPSRIERFAFRPFDERYLYRHDMRPLFSEPANELFALARDGNAFLVVLRDRPRDDYGSPAWWSRIPCDYEFLAGRSGHFPVWITAERPPRSESTTKPTESSRPLVANLSALARDYLRRLDYPDSDEHPETAMILWHHALAVMHTPSYLQENSNALQHGWPRIPLPGRQDGLDKQQAREALEASARQGKQIAEILSTPYLDAHAPSVHNPPAVDLLIGSVSHSPLAALIFDGHQTTPETVAEIDPESLSVRADWGIKAKGNAIRPRPGRIHSHRYATEQREALANLLRQNDIPIDRLDEIFGSKAVDAQLNPRAWWTGIPGNVWPHTIGGRQILPKWLSYREYAFLNRPLASAECRHFINIVRRLALLLPCV